MENMGTIIFCLILTTFYLGQILPRVIPACHEASVLFSFQDCPVSISKGVPQISVQIYEIKCGSFNVPISFSYHAGGRRISDEIGPVCRGWSLDAGVVITRTIKPDEGPLTTWSSIGPSGDYLDYGLTTKKLIKPGPDNEYFVNRNIWNCS